MSDRIFTSKDKEGKDVVLKFVRPNQKVLSDADFFYRQQFSRAIRNGIMTNAEALQIMKGQGLWTDEHEKQAAEMRRGIREVEEKFSDTSLSNDDGLVLVTKIKGLRDELSELNNRFSSITDNTAESMASEYRTQFYAANCVVYNNTGKRVFKDLEDFLSRVNEQLASDSYRESMIANFEQALGISVGSDLTADLVENKWVADRKIGEVKETEEVLEAVAETVVGTEEVEPKKRGRAKKA